MRVNADENITNWNDSLREIIRRLDWDYFELNDKSKKYWKIKTTIFWIQLVIHYHNCEFSHLS